MEWSGEGWGGVGRMKEGRKNIDFSWEVLKFIKKGSDFSREVLKFMKKGSDFSWEVLKFIKKGSDFSREVLKFRKKGSQKTRCFGHGRRKMFVLRCVFKVVFKKTCKLQ